MAPPPYLLVPTTEAPSQLISIVLGGQNALINLYTKSTFVPITPSGTRPVAPAVAFTGEIDGSVLTVYAIASGGLLLPDMYVYGAAVGNDTRILSQLTGAEGGLGTYSVRRSQTVPATAMTATTPPGYENVNPCFVDLYVASGATPIIGGVYVRQGALIVRDTYLGFRGDIVVYDTSGAGEDPYGVPAVLPAFNLRNQAQLASFPLSDGDRAPPSVAGRIPGMGTRFVMAYWPIGTYTPGYPSPH